MLKKDRWDDAARVILAFVLVGVLAFVVVLTTVYAVSGNAKDEATIESLPKDSPVSHHWHSWVGRRVLFWSKISKLELSSNTPTYINSLLGS